MCSKCNRSKTEESVDHRPENWRQELDNAISISSGVSSGVSSGSSSGSSSGPHSHSQNHSQNHENQKTRHQNQKPLTEKSNTEDEGNISTTTKPPEPLDFELFRSIYPKRLGSQEWRRAAHAANARIREGYTFEDMIEGAKRYALFCEATDKTGSLFVKQASTFLGPDLPFTELWTLPETTAERWQRRNRDTARSAVDLLEDGDE